ncbi:hypothetical protein [Microbacterium stercoris]|uniref:Head-to-tail stopper n=1 Tax=Microbacterium stercoris TaxID=2820289 RepID=A0A939QSC4_9MICO|nr:hypothetical protein [Microbacterium stercoris]MBO3663731.1 hypothetical protein [Microbacterium stercoris]
MDFPFGHKVYRLRARPKTDPYSGEQVPGDWSAPEELPIEGAFVAQTSTSMLGDATREQALESKSLYCDGALDIRKGDRIRDGEDGAPIYSIDGIPPAADTNPWTGWTPPREIPLTRGVG